LVVTIVLLASVPVRAEPLTGPDIKQLIDVLETQKAKIAEQERLLKDQMQHLDQQKDALAQQQQQINQLRDQFERAAQSGGAQGKTASSSQPIGRKLLDTLRGTGQPQTAENQQPVGQAPATPERAPEVTVLSDRGGVLTPKGMLVYEPSIDFAHSSDNQAFISGFTVLPALTVGEINIQKVNHDTIQQVNTFRYGITDRLELEARIPYVYATQATTARPLNTGSSADTVVSTSGSGLGDIEFGAHYQINNGQQGWPFLIGNVRFKTATGTDPFSVPLDANGLETKVPTGSGFYNVEPSITAIYPSDPAVFFANLGYIIGIGRTVTSPLVGGTANVEPGSAIHLSFGLGFGINEASSFSLGYDYSSFSSTKVNNVTQPGTDLQIGSVLIGYSYRFTDRISANLTTSIGVTSAAPNTQIILRVPIKFDLFSG
jgi:hypothetical protein